MIRFITLALVCAFTWSVGCQNAEDGHAHDDAQNVEHNSDRHTLHLNDGSRWKANPETTAGIQAMRQLVNNYEAEGSGDMGELHSKLLDGFNTIIQKCTMKGEAHNQLHLYLMPLSESIAALETCRKECQAVIDDINAHLEQYDKFFD